MNGRRAASGLRTATFDMERRNAMCSRHLRTREPGCKSQAQAFAPADEQRPQTGLERQKTEFDRKLSMSPLACVLKTYAAVPIANCPAPASQECAAGPCPRQAFGKKTLKSA